MDAIATDAPSEAPPRRHYDLHFREGPRGGLVLRYRDSGITLTDKGMEWYAEGQRRYTDYGTIEMIRLQTGHIPKSGYFGSCILTFRNGRNLTVTSLDSWGSPDYERLDDYAEFVQDLHGHLGDEDRKRIAFVAGMSEAKRAFGMVTMVIGAVFFVLLPLVLLFITGEIKALFLTVVGGGFVWPFFRILKKNAPRRYDPRHLDPDLFPHT